MRLYERYIRVELLRAYVLVNILLLGLFAIFDLSAQLDDAGTGTYTGLEAIGYTLGQLPLRWIHMTPFTALLATVVALGLMANRRELVVLQSATISPLRITASVLKAGAALLLLVVGIQLYVAPSLAQQVGQMRERALADGVIGASNGFWLRARDGVIRVGGLRQGYRPIDVDIYQYDTNHELGQFLHAAAVDVIGPDRWRLHDVTHKRFDDNGQSSQHRDTLIWHPSLYPAQLTLLDRAPQSLSPLALYHYVDYLDAQNQDAQRFRVALWQKLAIPFTTLAMILLATPLVFANPRGVHPGLRIAAAAGLGLGAYALIQGIGEMALLLRLNPPLFMLAPAVVIAGAAIIWLRRLN